MSTNQRPEDIYLGADSTQSLGEILNPNRNGQQQQQQSRQEKASSDKTSLLANADMSGTDYTIMSNGNTPQNGATGAAGPGPAVPSFATKLVLAIVNPLSGERSAADGLVSSLLSVLGEQRVLKLSPTVFRDPAPIGARITQGVQSVAAAHPADAFDGTTPQKRMSVIVAGGDGTVSFIIGVLERLVSDPNSGLRGVAPAIMVIPMGTGNDLSASLGCGQGFTANKCCSCCFCCPNDVELMLRTGLTAQVIPFDRWNSTMYRAQQPVKQLVATARDAETNVATLLRSALEVMKKQRSGGGALESEHNQASSGLGMNLTASATGAHTNSSAFENVSPAGVATAAAAAAAASGAEGNGAANKDGSSTTAITFDTIASFDFNNYFSFGLDAAIATDFDDKRKKYPGCHKSRTMNKVWYGWHGLAMGVKAIPLNNNRVSVSCDKNAVALSDSQNGCRAFVISNVTSYSGGVDLWSVDKTAQYQQTVPVPPGLPGKDNRERTVTYQPTSMSDGMVEVVSIGGFFHMGFLRVGSTGDKVAQGSNVTFALGDFSQSGELKGKGINFQVDGEPAGEFQFEPGAIVVDVNIQSRCYFHNVVIN